MAGSTGWPTLFVVALSALVVVPSVVVQAASCISAPVLGRPVVGHH
jgi:hypothetical protein